MEANSKDESSDKVKESLNLLMDPFTKALGRMIKKKERAT